jgi:hypothetical protein
VTDGIEGDNSIMEEVCIFFCRDVKNVPCHSLRIGLVCCRCFLNSIKTGEGYIESDSL